MGNQANNKRKHASQNRMFKALFEPIQTNACQTSRFPNSTISPTSTAHLYHHYDNVNELARDARGSILRDYVCLFEGDADGYAPGNLLIVFRHIYDNQNLCHIFSN